MSLRSTLASLLAAAVTLGASAASAAVYSEDFNAAGFVGSSLGLTGAGATSDHWANTDYFTINNYDGWTFAGGAYLAQNSGTTDGALLLNENGGVATTLIGLTAGQTYTLSLLLWGDNEPGQAYVFNASVDGAQLLSASGIDGAPGSNPGTTYAFNFTPTGNSATLVLSQASQSQASPIIDNISITEAAGGVPEPASWALMFAGFGLAGVALRHRQSYRLVEIATDGARSSETFRADDDQCALAQALEVAEGVAMEVWRDDTLVTRCDLSGLAAA
jgi:hypothetical protein